MKKEKTNELLTKERWALLVESFYQINKILASFSAQSDVAKKIVKETLIFWRSVMAVCFWENIRRSPTLMIWSFIFIFPTALFGKIPFEYAMEAVLKVYLAQFVIFTLLEFFSNKLMGESIKIFFVSMLRIFQQYLIERKVDNLKYKSKYYSEQNVEGETRNLASDVYDLFIEREGKMVVKNKTEKVKKDGAEKTTKRGNKKQRNT